MTPERWRQITGIFNGALALGETDAREAYLLEACADDPALRAEIESLLAAHGDTTSTFHGLLPAAAPTKTRLESGTRLGRYVVGTLLGAGGMGEVYRARDTRLNRDVALKILPRHLRAKPQLLARFEREAHAIAALKHPYICTLHDIGREGDIDYLIMELVEGDTLSARLARGPLSVEEAIAVARAVAEALAATHAQGIIHRDIKPSNIILTRDRHVKVVDFGLARESALVKHGDSTKGDQTEPGVRVGTPYYMSPEQALGEALDPRTDLFSLGVVLFECLTGQRPFDGESRSVYLQNLLSGPLRSATALRRDIPAALQSLLGACLHRDLSKRLDSASRLVAELDAIAASDRQPSKRLAAWIAVGTLAALATALWIASRPSTPGPLTTSYETAQLRRFTTTPGEEEDSRLSPDGMWMSFITTENGERRLQVRHIDGAEPRSVTLPKGELQSHLWAPDQTAFASMVWHGGSWTMHIVPTYFGADVPRQSVPMPTIGRGGNLLRWVGNAIFLQVEESGRSLTLRRLALTDGSFSRISGPWDGMQVSAFDVRPDGRQVVWAATAPGLERDDLWLASIDGGTATRITDTQDDSRKRYPLWNGDAKVVYQSTRGGQVDLWELDLPSRRSVRISSDSAIEDPESVAANGSLSYQVNSAKTGLVVWRTADGSAMQISNSSLSDFAPHVADKAGTHLAFQRSQPSPIEGFLQLDTDIFVAEVPPSLSGPLAAKKVATGFAPRLSPDAHQIAYLQRSREPRGRVQLNVTNIDTNVTATVSSLLALPANNSFPVDWIEQTVAWASPHDLFFIERYAQGAGSHIAHYRQDVGTTPVAATKTASRISDLYPSANGNTIAYLVRTPSQRPDQWNYALHLLDRTTGTTKAIRTFGPETLMRLRGWLPDNTALVIGRRLEQSSPLTRKWEVMTVSTDGGTHQAAIVDHVVNLSHMSASSPELYFTRVVEGVGNLWMFSFASGRQRQLTESPVRDVIFGAATPLGRNYVVGIRHEQTSDVYLLDTRPRNKSQ